MDSLGTLNNTLTTVCKALQIGCDVADLTVGVIECLEAPRHDMPIVKLVAGIARTAFSAAELGGRIAHISDYKMSVLKGTESLGMLLVVLPAEVAASSQDFVEDKINGIQYATKIISPFASCVRAGLEANIYTEKYYLGLTPEEREKEFRLVRKPGSDPEFPEYEKKPIILEECEKNLEDSQTALLPVAATEVALRTGAVSGAIKQTVSLYRRLATQLFLQQPPPAVGGLGAHPPAVPHAVPHAVPLAPTALDADPFDLLRFRDIPLELNEDPVFKRFTCPLTLMPVRDPVGDPTHKDRNGNVINNVYERYVMIAWINLHGTSPNTRLPLAVHQLIQKPALRALIESQLRHHGDRLRAEATAHAADHPPDHNLLTAAEQENPNS